MDFDESLEGMRVAVRTRRARSGPRTPRFGETPVVPGNSPDVVNSPRGGVVYSGYDHPNAARLIMDDELLPAGYRAVAERGRQDQGRQAVGVLDYDFSELPPRC